MIDEFIKNSAGPATKKLGRKAARKTKNAFANLLKTIDGWFTDFRWIEFCMVAAASFGSGIALGNTLLLDHAIAYKIGIFGLVVGSICYIRSPKTQWRQTNGNGDPEN